MKLGRYRLGLLVLRRAAMPHARVAIATHRFPGPTLLLLVRWGR